MAVQLHMASRTAWPENPSESTLCLVTADAAMAGCVARHALESGLEGFERRGPPGPVESAWVDGSGAFDDLLAAWLLTDGRDRAEEPGAVALADYAAMCRKGHSPGEVPLEIRPRCVFEELKRATLQAGRPGDSLDGFWRDLDALFRHLLDQLAAGHNLLTDDLFSGHLRFKEAVEMLRRDRSVYEDDRDGGQIYTWWPSWEQVAAPLLVIEEPRASRFADWARDDEAAPGGHGFTYLVVKHKVDGVVHWVLSVDPRKRRTVGQVAVQLQASEERAADPDSGASDTPDPWVDVAHLGGTLVASPRGGSRLSSAEVLSVLDEQGTLALAGISGRQGEAGGPPRSSSKVWLGGFVAVLALAAVAALTVVGLNRPDLANQGDPGERSTVVPECEVTRGEEEKPASRSELLGGGAYRALLIGIDDYAHAKGWRSLRTPVGDVEQLRSTLVSRYGFAPQNVQVLTNRQATARRVNDALLSLIDAGPKDMVFVYYGGHGARIEHQNRTIDGCWVLHDSTNGLRECAGGFPVSSVRKILARSKAKHVLLAVDSCFSGSIGTRGGDEDDQATSRCKLAGRSNLFLAAGNDSTEVNDEDLSGAHSPFAGALLHQLATAPGPVSLTGLRRHVDSEYERQGLRYRTVVDALPEGGRKTPHEFVFLPLIEPLSIPVGGSESKAAEEPPGRSRRALLVAVSAYPPDSGFDEPLASSRDLKLMRHALRRRGFEPIKELTDSNARAADLRKAWRELIDETRPGDVVVVHYSGHGVTLEDQDGDEIDGVDEALAPYGAHREVARGDPSAYIRDDALQLMLRELRRKAGARGHVLATFDSCYSGTVTRGGGSGASRGGRGAPRTAHARRDQDRGGMDAHREQDDEGLAPFVVLSAAASDQPAREARVGGQNVGSLVWAFTSALTRQAGELTYRELYDDIAATMRQTVPGQHPQVEGDLDTRVLDGAAVSQAPYVRIRGTHSGLLQLDGGLLAGLAPGAVVALHEAGTRWPEPARRFGVAVVEQADSLTSQARPQGIRAEKAARLWAFVQERSFGTFTFSVAAAPRVAEADRRALRSELERTPILLWTESSPAPHGEDLYGVYTRRPPSSSSTRSPTARAGCSPGGQLARTDQRPASSMTWMLSCGRSARWRAPTLCARLSWSPPTFAWASQCTAVRPVGPSKRQSRTLGPA